MIIASAIRLADGSVYVGKRHGDCFANLKYILEKTGMDQEVIQHMHFNCEQGFINDWLQFLTREEAYYEAFHFKQCKEQHFIESKIKGLDITEENWEPCLASEDLW
jgi:hypothetical protein